MVSAPYVFSKIPVVTGSFARHQLADLYTKDEELKIVEMINSGCNYKEIAHKLGRPYYGLYDKVKRMGLNF